MDDPPVSRRHLLDRAVIIPLVLSILVAAFALVEVGSRLFEDVSAEAEPTTTTTTSTAAPTTTTTAPEPQPVVPVSTTLASPNGNVPVYDRPGGTEISTAGYWYGYEMTMPVVEETWGWVRIMLPERPNQSTGWVRVEDVTLSSTAYRMVLDRTETKVVVYKDGFELMSMPGGFGKASTPTPLGSYFVAVVENPGPRGYGPVVLNLSAHSEAIQSWQGAGDAIIALHGPFGSESRIGTTGTYISNGCIRLHTEDQLKLAEVPVGTPVDIVA